VPEFTPGKSFLYVGRLSAEKGLLTLVKAAAHAGVSVRLVGVGPQLAELRNIANRLKSDVTFLGRVTGTPLQDEIRSSRATVLPSEWYENAPMGILESYALGKPVIAANIGGIPELLQHGVTGWGFESRSVDQLSEALRKVAALPDSHIMEMGRAARRLVEDKYSAELYAERMQQLYYRVGVKLSRIGGSHGKNGVLRTR
jgi:glycosyltransferase involved in cell wall biosynthesis